jgi:CheY-like chemotaxis protein
VETRLGEGSRFDLYLPRATRARPPEGATDRAGTAPTGTETILLVEDQSELRDLLEEVLATLGYRVLSAPTPTAALALVEQHAGRIDLLVTDVVMPKMSGYELARQIGELRQGIRVLYMSGYAPEQTTHGEGEGPPSSLLSKPFDPHELAVRIRSTLDGEG